MAAVCVQAIWTASAASISSLGAAASIIASAAFMESPEIPPKGERAAACIWNNEALTKSLDVVPRALFSRHHQCLASPSGGWTLASLPSARHTLTRTGGRRRWPATGVGELFGLWVIPSSRCWQTTEREIAATSAPRWRPPSSFRCENFHSRDRVAHRGSAHRAAYTACGRVRLGIGTLYRRASVPHNAVLAFNYKVVSQRLGAWGCSRVFYCPLRPSASLGSREGLRPRQRCMRRAALTANGRQFFQSQCSSYLGNYSDRLDADARAVDNSGDDRAGQRLVVFKSPILCRSNDALRRRASGR